MGIQRKSKTYDEFVDKFKARHTTDDCFTPANIYAVVLDWAAKKYGFDKTKVVRPFCPGGDYQAFEYEPDAVVLDNSPFSIVSKICHWYCERGIRFFLFCPGLSAFNVSKDLRTVTIIGTGLSIVYDNGASVNTAFVTNMGGDILCEVSSELRERLKVAIGENSSRKKEALTFGLKRPPDVLSSADLATIATRGVDYSIKRSDAVFIRHLDCGVEVFGGALLLSERAAAERAATHVLKLSPREKELQRQISITTSLPVRPRLKSLKPRLKSLGAIRTDDEPPFAPRAQRGVFERLTRGRPK